jgi:hypothetical protein
MTAECSTMKDAVADPIVFPGTVEWSGENPGISLRETPDGPFVVLASFFRVVLSPYWMTRLMASAIVPPQNSTGFRTRPTAHLNPSAVRWEHRRG